MASDSARRFVLTLVLLADYPQCDLQDHTCAIRLWTQRAADLGAAIARQAGPGGGQSQVAVDVFSGCTAADSAGDDMGVVGREASDGAVEWPVARGVILRHHATLPEALVATQAVTPASYDRSGKLLHRSKRRKRRRAASPTLLKWVAVSLVHAEFAAVIDLDTNPFPDPVRMYAREAASDWLQALGRMRTVGAHLATLPMGTAPLWGGFFIVRTSLQLYDEGVALLARADQLFNATHGWGLSGRPRDVLPPSDVLWTRHGVKHANWVLSNVTAQGANLWTFGGAPMEEGLYLYMYRVRRAYPFGIELRELPSGPEPTTYGVVHEVGKPWLRHWSLAPACVAPAGSAARTSSGAPEAREPGGESSASVEPLPIMPKASAVRNYGWFANALRDLASRPLAHGVEVAGGTRPVVNASARAECARAWRETLDCIRRRVGASPGSTGVLDEFDQLDRPGLNWKMPFGIKVFAYVGRTGCLTRC